MNTYVIKNTIVKYNAYWNEEKNKWVGLLEATKYTDKPANVKNGEILTWDEVLTNFK